MLQSVKTMACPGDTWLGCSQVVETLCFTRWGQAVIAVFGAGLHDQGLISEQVLDSVPRAVSGQDSRVNDIAFYPSVRYMDATCLLMDFSSPRRGAPANSVFFMCMRLGALICYYGNGARFARLIRSAAMWALDRP